jgi:hypothetical protein
MRTTPSRVVSMATIKMGERSTFARRDCPFAEEGRRDAVLITRESKTEARVAGWYVGGHGPALSAGTRPLAAKRAAAEEAERCPAASATASSRKKSSVQLRPAITSRCRPL